MSDELRNLLAEGELERALAKLVELAAASDPALEDDARTLLFRARRIQRDAELGTETQERAGAVRAQITQAALHLARRLSPVVPVTPPAEAARSGGRREPGPLPPAPAAQPHAPPLVAALEAQPSPAAPLRIFVSYAHEGPSASGPRSSYLDELLIQVKPLVREGLARVWSDRRIDDGLRFDDVIHAELVTADAAILLVNARFLASDYIYEKELPALLERWDAGLLTLFVLVLEPCDLAGVRFRYTDRARTPREIALGALQTAHPPDRPLSGESATETKRILTALSGKLRSLARARSEQPSKPR